MPVFRTSRALARRVSKAEASSACLGKTILFLLLALPLPPATCSACDQGAEQNFLSVELLDPVPFGSYKTLLDGSSVTTDIEVLEVGGRAVQGVGADGVTQVVIRILSPCGGNLTFFLFDEKKHSMSSDDDGGLGAIGAAKFTENTLTVRAVTTKDGKKWWFAIYRAPMDFVRAQNAKDKSLASRQTLLAFGPSIDHTQGMFINILRPPIMLVHGIWADPSSWKEFRPLITDSKFVTVTARYDTKLDITDSNPKYTMFSEKAPPTANSLGFAFNAASVLKEIVNEVVQFKKGKTDKNVNTNPLGIPVAAVQADVVAHSMGGDVVRTMPLLGGKVDEYRAPYTLGAGSIHKLITVGTPHLGSPLALQLLNGKNDCSRNVLADNGIISFITVSLKGMKDPVNGGVGDLQGDGTGGQLSEALKNLQAAPKLRATLPTALLAATMANTNTDSLATGNAAKLRSIFGCPNDFIAMNLDKGKWQNVFNGKDSDAVVPLTSELNNGKVVAPFPGVVHSEGIVGQDKGLSFTGPYELQQDQFINKVTDLLNTPVTDKTAFVPLL